MNQFHRAKGKEHEPFKIGFRRRRGPAISAVALIGLGGGVGTAVFASTSASPSPTASSPSSLAIESWSQCNPSLCIDAPPEGKKGLDGSGGWGWNDTTNRVVTTLTSGVPASLTVTAMQPNPAATPGTITLTYSSHDIHAQRDRFAAGVTGTDPLTEAESLCSKRTLITSHTTTAVLHSHSLRNTRRLALRTRLSSRPLLT